MAVTGLSRGGSEKLTFVSVKDLNRISIHISYREMEHTCSDRSRV